MCSNWGQSNFLHFNLGGLDPLPAGEVDETAALEELLYTSGTRASTIFVGDGFGRLPNLLGRQGERDDRMSTAWAWEAIYGPILNATARYGRTRLLLTTLTPNAGTQQSQTPESLADFNEWLHALARNHSTLGVSVLDTRAALIGTYSRDGVHRGSHDNVALAQLFLNILDSPPAEAERRTARGTDDGLLPDDPPEPLWLHGPLRNFYAEEMPHVPGLVDFLGPHLDLRSCRCWRDYAARAAANASAPLCYCRGWCPPQITPEFLTYAATTGCTGQGWNFERDDPNLVGSALCGFSCVANRAHQKSPRFEGEPCGAASSSGRLCVRPQQRCAPCSRPGEEKACHPMCAANIEDIISHGKA